MSSEAKGEWTALIIGIFVIWSICRYEARQSAPLSVTRGHHADTARHAEYRCTSLSPSPEHPQQRSLSVARANRPLTNISSDATAGVPTLVAHAAAKAAKAELLPSLLICGFIANAASFVLPISNPANLMRVARHMPQSPMALFHEVS